MESNEPLQPGLDLEAEKQHAEMETRDAKCRPIAEEVIQIISGHKPDLSIFEQEKVDEMYGEIYMSVIKVFVEKNLTPTEINHVFKLVSLPFSNTGNFVKQRIQESLIKAERKLWGVDPYKPTESSVTLKMIDDILTADTKK